MITRDERRLPLLSNPCQEPSPELRPDATRIAGGPWDTRRESYQDYERRRERAPEMLLVMLRGSE